MMIINRYTAEKEDVLEPEEDLACLIVSSIFRAQRVQS